MTDYAKICPRRGTATEWTVFNPILLDGEMGIEYPDSGLGTGLVKIKFGDGITPWLDLEYSVNPNEATNIIGGDSFASHDIFIRGDTYENWKANNPILGINEIVYDQTHRSIKIGDGIHSFLNLPYIGFDDFDFDFDFGDLDENPNDSSHDVDFNELNRGKDGKSAYEIWLEEGHEGSVQDFLDSLIGADGKSAFEVWRDDYMHDPTLTVDDYVEYMTTTSWSDMDEL